MIYYDDDDDDFEILLSFQEFSILDDHFQLMSNIDILCYNY